MNKHTLALTVGILGFLAIAGGYYQLGYVPQQQEIAQLDTENTKLLAEVATGQSKLALSEAISTRNTQAQLDLAQFRTRIPSEAKISTLVTEIADSAREMNVDLHASDIKLGKETETIKEIAINSDMEGNLGQIYNLIRLLHSKNRTYQEGPLSLSVVGNKNNHALISSKVLLHAYYSKAVIPEVSSDPGPIPTELLEVKP